MSHEEALGFSWYALSSAAKLSHEGMTFGYHRVGIFAAIANAVSLVLIAVFIGWEAIARIREPQVANGPVMIVVAVAAIIVNLVISLLLHKGSKDDLILWRQPNCLHPVAVSFRMSVNRHVEWQVSHSFSVSGQIRTPAFFPASQSRRSNVASAISAPTASCQVKADASWTAS